MRAKMRRLAAPCVALLLVGGSWAVAADKFFPPLHAILGCEGTDLNVVIVDCEGSPPYTQMTCTFTRIAVTKQDASTSQKNREEFSAASARLTEAERLRQVTDACETVAKGSNIDFTKLSPSVRLMRERAVQMLRATCDCKGKDPECLTRAILPILDAEERTCTVSIFKHQDTFKKIDKNRWVYSESLPVSCVAASTQVLENDPQHPNLWTYTLNELAATTNPFPNTPLCADYKGANEVCSWKYPAQGLLTCEVVKLQ